jgi:hypothetical protein
MKKEKNRLLVLICSCQGYQDRKVKASDSDGCKAKRAACRETWLATLPHGVSYAFFVGVIQHALPLSHKFVLYPLPEIRFCDVLFGFDARDCDVALVFFPECPLLITVLDLERHKKRVIVKPVFVLFYKCTVSLVSRKS